MSLSNRIKTLLLDSTQLPQEIVIGLADPRSEIELQLDGVAADCSIACVAPFIVCVAFRDPATPPRRAVLKLRDRENHTLGALYLRYTSSIAPSSIVPAFALYRVFRAGNFCLPLPRRLPHYLFDAWSHLRRANPDFPMTLLEQRAMAVSFIRPHPIYLASVGDETRGNMFPLNLLSELGQDYVSLAIRDRRLASDLVERAGCLAISGVPVSQCPIAYQLAANHKKEFVEWRQLPFAITPSPSLSIPRPAFATNLRELRIEQVHRLGSHRFFLARIVTRETYNNQPQACVIHGSYQYSRLHGDPEKLRISLAEDRIHKGMSQAHISPPA
jgi:flavin reductase (DIM6/NTAB) family NADH-FMN oxidoreductase RutF